MERLGPSLAQLQKGGTLTPLVLQQASAGAAMALKFIHEQFGLAHSEVKPGNIVLANPQTTRVKLIDYDCAVFLDDSQQREADSQGRTFTTRRKQRHPKATDQSSTMYLLSVPPLKSSRTASHPVSWRTSYKRSSHYSNRNKCVALFGSFSISHLAGCSPAFSVGLWTFMRIARALHALARILTQCHIRFLV